MLYMYSYKKTLERTAGAIRNGTIIDTANIEQKKQKEDSKKHNTEN